MTEMFKAQKHFPTKKDESSNPTRGAHFLFCLPNALAGRRNSNCLKVTERLLKHGHPLE